MMEGWKACFFVLIVDLAFGKDILVSNSTYVIKPIDSCPIEGYFFKREPTHQNVIRSESCYLCFCRDNGTAICWERDYKRCDVERYHHHRVGRQSRIRRSPISLKDIFFQDASKNFIKKKLPQECNPAGESFSDGCPPEDWCIGCTVCDCASNGRWDCHVLSFCDGKEKKKKLKGISKRIGVTSPVFEKNIGKKTVVRKRSSNAKDTTPAKQPTKVVKKPAQVPKNKPQNKTKKKQKQPPNKQVMRPPVKKSSKMKPQPKKPVPKKARLHVPKSNVSKVKVIRKNVTSHKNLNLPRANNKRKVIKINPNNNNDTVKLGEKIVKQVMTAVHKLLMKEIGKINATARKQRSINLGKDCSQTKKLGKKTYNVKSNAVPKIKNRYNKRHNLAKINWKGIKGRFKREILDGSNIDNTNVTVITLSPDIHAVIPLEGVKSENSTIINSSDHVVRDPSTTTKEDNNYNKYLIKDNGYVNLSFVINESTTMIPKSDGQDTTPDMFLNFVVPIETTSRINQKFEDEMTTKKINISGQSQRKDIEQRYHAIKKHNNTHTTRYYSSMPPSYSRNHFISNNKTDVTGLSIILQNLLKNLKNNKTARVKPKPKISIMKYVRRFFRKIFSKKKAGSRKHYGIGPKEDHTLQTLCENIGPCNINKKNKFILKYKLKRLNEETKTILRSIGIIKGLLHLLDFPGIDVSTNIKNSHSFHNDVRKLSVVLRDNYSMEDKNLSLTDTQITQINYIKNNTQTFIESVKKFADILNETIALIRPKNTEHNNTPGYSSNKIKSEMSFDKIKKMLFKYNLIQNTFMRRMYELIKGVEKNTTNTTITEKNTQMCDAKEISTRNPDEVIEKYSRNIIVKLRRLKNLAQVLSSKRKRRNIRGRNDALDYLLTLMEYLIKQNHPLNSFPANDGIDVLIDAIRNAPVIKPNKRKFLRVKSAARNLRLRSKINLSDQLPDDSNSDSYRISKEVNQLIENEHILNKEEILINKEQGLINREEKLINRENIILAKEKNQINPDESLSNKEDNILSRANNHPERTTETVDGSILRGFYKFNNPKPVLFDNIYHTTTEKSITKKHSEEEKYKIGFEKFESNIDDSKKFEVFSNDVDDDASGDMANNPSSVFNSTRESDQRADEETTDTTIIPNTTVNTISNSNESSSESQDALNDIRKTKLDWIEETFDKEIRELEELTTPKTKPTNTMDWNTVSTTVSSTVRNAENISGISAEIENAVGKNKKATENSRKNDVMYQKQLAFLTSLDYAATEKSDFEESDSGDVGKADDGVTSFYA